MEPKMRHKMLWEPLSSPSSPVFALVRDFPPYKEAHIAFSCLTFWGILPQEGEGGGGVLPIMAYTGRFRPREVPLSGHLFGQKRINLQSAYIIFKMFSLRLKLNLRKPDVFKFTRFEAGICDERLPEVPRL